MCFLLSSASIKFYAFLKALLCEGNNDWHKVTCQAEGARQSHLNDTSLSNNGVLNLICNA